jgi:hypothetical protein
VLYNNSLQPHSGRIVHSVPFQPLPETQAALRQESLIDALDLGDAAWQAEEFVSGGSENFEAKELRSKGLAFNLLPYQTQVYRNFKTG